MRRSAALVVIVVLGLLAACGNGTASVATHRDGHVGVDYSKLYGSIDSLLADTKLLVVATARSVRRDPVSPPNQPRSLVTMSVDRVLGGTSHTSSIVVAQADGARSGSAEARGRMRAGSTYLLCLGQDAPARPYYVLGGVAGLFTYNAAADVATAVDTSAIWLPPGFSLELASDYLHSLSLRRIGPTPVPTTTTSTTLAPPIPGACPPGCSLPSDYDAMTVLASGATEVALVSVLTTSDPLSGVYPVVRTDLVVQGNPHSLPYPPSSSDLAFIIPQQSSGLTNGGQYLVFVSYNRGGPCLSALFSFDPSTQTATWMFDSAGGSEEGTFVLDGRALPFPRAFTLTGVRQRMYPTGDVVYADGSAERSCPGP